MINKVPMPAHAVSRETRGLVQRLAFIHPANPVRVIAFIAARPGEGTSTIAGEYALGTSIEVSQKVLLVDAGPLVAERYLSQGMSSAKGLVELAMQGRSPAEAATQVADNVFVARLIGRSENRGSLTKLINNPEFWDDLKETFDTIVIDCPSLQVSFDGIVMAGKADAVVIVVEAESTRQPVIENLRDTLLSADATVAGIVMNKRRFYIPHRAYRKL